MTRADFHTSEPGWLAYASGRLFYKPMLDKYAELTVVNVDSLIEEDTYIFDGILCPPPPLNTIYLTISLMHTIYINL